MKAKRSPAISAVAFSLRTGFTLIEIVISAALASMILIAAYLCLKSGLSSQKLIEARTDIFQSARVAMALMSADLRCACRLSKQLDFVGIHRMLGDIEADNLDFATHNYTPQRLRESDFCEVSYFLEKEPKSGKLSLWRRRDPTPDDQPLAGGSREEIARGLKGLRFEYYDGYDWYDEWGETSGRRKGQSSLLDPPNLSGMPEAVRITIWFDTKPRISNKADPTNEATAAQDASEPPLVFQTVARLNLAAISLRSSSSGSASNNISSAPSQTTQGTPDAPRR